jgi:hypothetical protein
MFVFAEFTRSTLKESWATAQRHAIERGIHISPTTYLGYDIGPDRRLVPNGQPRSPARCCGAGGADRGGDPSQTG